MPTIVGILTFMSRINFMLSWDEHERKFYNIKAWYIFWFQVLMIMDFTRDKQVPIPPVLFMLFQIIGIFNIWDRATCSPSILSVLWFDFRFWWSRTLQKIQKTLQKIKTGTIRPVLSMQLQIIDIFNIWGRATCSPSILSVLWFDFRSWWSWTIQVTNRF